MSPDNRRWYTLPADKAVDLLGSDPETGLDSEEAEKRSAEHGENEIFPVNKVSFASCVRKVALDPLSVLLVLACVLSAFFGNFAALIAILPAVALNYFLIAFAYTKAEQIFAGMSEDAMPVTTVIRDGAVRLVPIKALVPGDIILLKEGQVVPADARLIESDRLAVLETGITANSGSVTKNAEQYDARMRKPHECANMVYAATIVIRGHGKAVVTAVGSNTVVGKKGRRRAPAAYVRPATIRSLGTLSYITGLLLVIAVSLLTVLNLTLKNYGALDGLITALAFAAAFMSESYAMLGYFSVAVGMFGSLDRNKKVNSGCLIKNTAGLEALKDVTTIMIPCDSVFSEKNIKLNKLYVHGRMLDLASCGLTDEEKDNLTEKEQEIRVSEKRTLLIQALISTGNYTAQRVNLKNQRGDIYTYEENAIINAASDAGIYNISLDEKYPIIGHAGADEAPFETTLISWYGENRIFVRGEVSEVLSRCTDYTTGHDGTTAPLTGGVMKNIETVARQMMRQSMRVAAIASGASRYRSLTRMSELYNSMVFEGLIGFEEPGLPGAAYNIARCRDAGIKVVLFSDKDDEKSRQLARSLGIVNESEGDKVIGAYEARQMSAEIFRTELPDCKLFCGFSTRERRKIIADLRSRGEKVAHLALSTEELILSKEADVAATQVVTLSKRKPVSFSASEMSSDGSDALRFSSDVIVSSVDEKGKGGFNALVGAVSTAKSIYRNLGSVMTYLIFMNCARLALVLLSYFSFTGTVFAHPVQLAFTGLMTDLAAVFSIIFIRPGKEVLFYRTGGGRFPISGAAALLSAAGGIASAVIAALCAGYFSRFAASDRQSALLCLIFTSLLMFTAVLAFESKKDTPFFIGNLTLGNMDLALTAAVTAVIALTYIIEPLGYVFGVGRTGLAVLLSAFIVPAGLFIACEAVKLYRYRRSSLYKKVRRKRNRSRRSEQERGDM